ncbi:MAG: hypothetical protein ACK55Z_32640 [bacterium]
MPRVPAAVIAAPNTSRAMAVDARDVVVRAGMGAGCPVEVAQSQVVLRFCVLWSVCARCSVRFCFFFVCNSHRGGEQLNG